MVTPTGQPGDVRRLQEAGFTGYLLKPVREELLLDALAVALAAQRTFANFLGGFLLYLNKPVRVGDFCLFGDGKMGTVEEIGLLSTSSPFPTPTSRSTSSTTSRRATGGSSRPCCSFATRPRPGSCAT